MEQETRNIVNSVGVSKDVEADRVTSEGAMQHSIPADPYANVKRELSPEELQSTAVQKLLLDANNRMKQDNERLKEIEKKYHERDKEVAVLYERLKVSTGSEILYTFSETVGAGMMGVSSIFWDQKGWIILVLGAMLVLGGIVYKLATK